MIMPRNALSLATLVGSMLLAGCASTATPTPAMTATIAPDTPTPAPTATVTVTVTPTRAPTPIPEPINMPRLYDGPLPEGAVARLGQGWPSQVVTSPDEKLVAVGMSTGVQVYDTDTLALLWAQPTTERVSVVAWSHDSAKVAAGLCDGRTLIWKAKSGVGLFDLASDDGMIDALDWTPAGAYLIASTSKGFTKI